MTDYAAARMSPDKIVKELIKQNSDKLGEVWPTAPYGILSSGLKQREFNLPIIFGGVKTVVNALDQIGRFDVLLIKHDVG